MEKEIETMLKLGAAYNASTAFADANIDDAPFSADACVKTHEPISVFTASDPIMEAAGAKFYLREGFQIRKGLCRGELYIADFGTHRLVAFTGEGVIQ